LNEYHCISIVFLREFNGRERIPAPRRPVVENRQDLWVQAACRDGRAATDQRKLLQEWIDKEWRRSPKDRRTPGIDSLYRSLWYDSPVPLGATETQARFKLAEQWVEDRPKGPRYEAEMHLPLLRRQTDRLEVAPARNTPGRRLAHASHVCCGRR